MRSTWKKSLSAPRARRDNARVENGHLIIEARRDRYDGHEYTSARLNSTATWRYGHIEARAKLPSGRGTWPAIWMLNEAFLHGGASWPDSGEIDIMEHVGHDPDVVHASIHTKAFNHVAGTQKTATVPVAGAREGFQLSVFRCLAVGEIRPDAERSSPDHLVRGACQANKRA